MLDAAESRDGALKGQLYKRKVLPSPCYDKHLQSSRTTYRLPVFDPSDKQSEMICGYLLQQACPVETFVNDGWPWKPQRLRIPQVFLTVDTALTSSTLDFIISTSTQQPRWASLKFSGKHKSLH
jgi:hypothetical protein